MKRPLYLLALVAVACLLLYVGYTLGARREPAGDETRESVPVGFSGVRQNMIFSQPQIASCSTLCDFHVQVIKAPATTNEARCNATSTTYSYCILINDAAVVNDKCKKKPCKQYIADVILEWNP
jgi:hypothetical protein